MGREAECAVTYNGRREKRKVLLETDEIVLRGDPRVVVKRAAISRAEANEGALVLAWKGGEATLELGKDAAKWANDIVNPRSRLDKLGVKAGQKVALLHVTDEALRPELEKAGAAVTKARTALDVVFVQADAPAALARIEGAAKAIAPAGAVWVLTPRGIDGLKDTDVIRAGKAAGLVDVKVVRFSETHTANKLVVPVAKRPKQRRRARVGL